MKKHTYQSASKMNRNNNILDRDRPGPVSVSQAGTGKPSYTHNADKSDPIDPHLADQSRFSNSKGSKLGARK